MTVLSVETLSPLSNSIQPLDGAVNRGQGLQGAKGSIYPEREDKISSKVLTGYTFTERKKSLFRNLTIFYFPTVHIPRKNVKNKTK